MVSLKTLAELVSRAGGAQAVGLDPDLTWDRLVRRRSAWVSALGPARGTVALYLPDGFEFAAALLAAWSLGASVILPGDASPGTLDALGAYAQRVFIGDSAAPPDCPHVSAEPLTGMPSVPLIVFTSGSTGDPVAIPKPLRCVQNELDSIEKVFGDAVDGADFFSTVSHQHYYGLLFKILWPLSAGRPFLGRQLRLPEEFAAAAAKTRRCALVSSPALLKRIGDTPESIFALEQVRASVAAVFSSGGPLPFDAVRRCRTALGQTPTEVYGSSESGGVAWRRRESEAAPWIPLPGVETAVDEQGVLTLRSGHAPSRDWTPTDDLAAPMGAGFRLLGRVDSIVKVEEKRVSLTGLERGLVGHPVVEEARVLLLGGVRDVLGAVVRLKRCGPLTAPERRAMALDLRRHLARGAEAVVLPRRWRFVDRLPTDSMGKTTQDALRALFNDGETLEPECVYVQGLEQGVELDLYLPESLRWFRGHFPGQPLLPGVVQLHWAIQAAREHLGINGPFRGLRALKFTRPLRPGARVTLTLTRATNGFEFRFASEEGRHAGGQVLLG